MFDLRYMNMIDYLVLYVFALRYINMIDYLVL